MAPVTLYRWDLAKLLGGPTPSVGGIAVDPRDGAILVAERSAGLLLVLRPGVADVERNPLPDAMSLLDLGIDRHGTIHAIRERGGVEVFTYVSGVLTHRRTLPTPAGAVSVAPNGDFALVIHRGYREPSIVRHNPADEEVWRWDLPCPADELVPVCYDDCVLAVTDSPCITVHHLDTRGLPVAEQPVAPVAPQPWRANETEETIPRYRLVNIVAACRGGSTGSAWILYCHRVPEDEANCRLLEYGGGEQVRWIDFSGPFSRICRAGADVLAAAGTHMSQHVCDVGLFRLTGWSDRGSET